MSRPISANRVKAAFIAGNVTCASVVIMGALFVGYRVGFGRLVDKVREVVFAQDQRRIECPEDVLAELTTIHAVIENAGNPTNAKEHDSVMVEPDKDFRYRLRSEAKVAGYVLKTVSGSNYDPPVLYLNAGAEISSNALRWIEQNTRNQFIYTTTAKHVRTTLPLIETSRRCLFVGDSVCFGVGVDDEDTIPSIFQSELGSDLSVTNAGVGGYDGHQAFRKAEQLSGSNEFECAVYIACDNDFNDESPDAVMQRFTQIQDRFSKGICVLYTPYLEYLKGELIYGGNGSENWNEKGDQRRQECRVACEAHGLAFIDLTDHIELRDSQQKTIFSGLELFVDHCHLSQAGNRLAAELLLSQLYAEERSSDSRP